MPGAIRAQTSVEFLARRGALLVLLVAALALFLAVPARALGIFSGLGQIAGGAVVATGISGDGSTVIGNAMRPAPPELQPRVGATIGEASRWTRTGGWQGLGDLPGIWGSVEGSWATGISTDGSTVVGGATSGGPEGFRWTSSSGLQPLAGVSGPSIATGISGDGSKIVGLFGFTPQYPSGVNSYLWTSATGLEQIVGDDRIYAAGTYISADGSTIVGWRQPFGIYRSTSSEGTTNVFPVIELSCGEGCTISQVEDDFIPAAVSVDGSVIAGTRWTGEGVRWTETGGIEVIGFSPIAMSGDGSFLVGGSAVWDPLRGTRSLEHLLVDEYGLDLAGWSLGNAVGVSADGSTLVGNGINPGGHAEAWIAFLPEPSTAVLLLIGLAGLGARQRAG